MTEIDKQTAVDATNATAEPVAAVDNAQGTGDDLDALLKQFDTETKVAPATPQTPQAQQGDVNVLAELSSLRSQVAQVSNMKVKQDLDTAIKDIRGDIDRNIVDDEIAEFWLDAQAKKDLTLQKLWLERDSNPRLWQKAKVELGKRFAKRFSNLPDRILTEDRQAVAAAVRGASTKAPTDPAPNYSTMNNQELRDEYRKLGINPTF